MITRYFTLWLIALSLVALTSCSDDEETISTNNRLIELPDTYRFTRNDQLTVAFDGQTQRIGMATELVDAMKNFDQATAASLLEMYRNEAEGGGDANPFAEASLNESDKSVREKVAASQDYFSANATEGTAIKNQFEDWLTRQVTEVFANQEVAAAPGIAGQVADGSTVRYVNAQGLEYNQLVAKGLLGALMMDQMLNNYLSLAVLDEGESREANNEETLEEGENYTFMEHTWDEAYGYAYGASADPANPNATIGDDDKFLNEYIGQVNQDPDFAGIADDIFNALKVGRAAIVVHDYEVRDRQVAVVQEKVSKVIAIRGVYYLQQGKAALEQESADNSGAFHALSEAYGFIYSLRFTRQPGTGAPYLVASEADGFLTTLLGDGANGLWDVTPETLNTLSEAIAGRFDFTVEQTGRNE